MIFNKLKITVLIMTQNEEKNIGYLLDSIHDYFDQIIITDSYSTDNTLSIINKYKNVELYENNFISWADQRNWILNNTKINNDIVFFLDADEVISNTFIYELKNKLNEEFDSIAMNFNMFFMGKHIKFSYGHPTVPRIFHKNNLIFYSDGAREYANYQKKIVTMNTPVHHEDHKGITYWIEKHNSNATREAILHFETDFKSEVNLSLSNKIKSILRKKVWYSIPIIIRPSLYFFYRYIIRLGFMDGVEGFYYCFLHAFWYRILIDIKIHEKNN